MKPLVILLALLLGACTSDDSAMRALNGAGYKDVRLTGYRFFGCSDDDFFRDGFEAVGANGQKVSGVVCGAFLKGSTIRTD